jgi:hypothetical protein
MPVKKTKRRPGTFLSSRSVDKTDFSDLEKRISPRDDGYARDGGDDEFELRKTSSFFIFLTHREFFCKRVREV